MESLKYYLIIDACDNDGYSPWGIFFEYPILIDLNDALSVYKEFMDINTDKTPDEYTMLTDESLRYWNKDLYERITQAIKEEKDRRHIEDELVHWRLNERWYRQQRDEISDAEGEQEEDDWKPGDEFKYSVTEQGACRLLYKVPAGWSDVHIRLDFCPTPDKLGLIYSIHKGKEEVCAVMWSLDDTDKLMKAANVTTQTDLIQSLYEIYFVPNNPFNLMEFLFDLQQHSIKYQIIKLRYKGEDINL